MSAVGGDSHHDGASICDGGLASHEPMTFHARHDLSDVSGAGAGVGGERGHRHATPCPHQILHVVGLDCGHHELALVVAAGFSSAPLCVADAVDDECVAGEGADFYLPHALHIKYLRKSRRTLCPHPGEGRCAGAVGDNAHRSSVQALNQVRRRGARPLRAVRSSEAGLAPSLVSDQGRGVRQVE